jgi:hypothetical protein
LILNNGRKRTAHADANQRFMVSSLRPSSSIVSLSSKLMLPQIALSEQTDRPLARCIE